MPGPLAKAQRAGQFDDGRHPAVIGIEIGIEDRRRQTSNAPSGDAHLTLRRLQHQIHSRQRPKNAVLANVYSGPPLND